MRHRISAKGNVWTGETEAGMAQVFTALAANQLHCL